ncbi:MAG: hypothetical protein D6795_12820 [Deltaproteobacteria bacterium]|nr:MAG: hypothetical protein D6795_12820 [Deltaproteobacteria bacterium]
MSVFSNLKRVNRWFGGREEEASKDALKARLEVVLTYDRIGIRQETVASLKREIGAVLAKYFDVHEEDIEISFQRNASRKMVQVESPFKIVHRRSFSEQG